jgi:hypothetical protein
MSRTVLATGLSASVLGAFLVNHWRVAEFHRKIRQQIASGSLDEIPPGTPLRDVGVRVSAGFIRAITIDAICQQFWFILLPLVVALCFGVAVLLTPGTPTVAAPPPPASR